MDAALLDDIGTEIHRATGRPLGVCEARAVAGGCIHEAYILVALTPYFVKVNTAARAGLFDAEMDALRALASTGAIRVPRPVVTGRHADRSYLVLEYVPMTRAAPTSWEWFGAQLAAMHRHLSPEGTHGWHCANFIGTTPQPNVFTRDWLTFWREERLGFQFKLAAERGERFAGADRLLSRLSSFFEDYTPDPSLLHGDLWSGNASFTDEGLPIIYDPASYYGDRECDLAFTELFGAFPPAFYESYGDAWPPSCELAYAARLVQPVPRAQSLPSVRRRLPVTGPAPHSCAEPFRVRQVQCSSRFPRLNAPARDSPHCSPRHIHGYRSKLWLRHLPPPW